MEAASSLADMLEALLSPLEETLSRCADDPEALGGFRDHCEHAACVLQDVGEPEAAALTQTLRLLSEVLSGVWTTGDGGPDEAGEDILAFLHSGVRSLREGLAGGPEAAVEFNELLETAQSTWSDHLQLFDDLGDTEKSSSDDALEETSQGRSPEQIDLILSALGGAAEAAAPSSVVPAPARAMNAEPAPPRIPPPGSDRAPSDSPELDAELVEAYLEDAVQCLSSMERAILDFETDPESVDPAELLCRELHTLKGASASVGFDALASQLHDVEQHLEDYRKTQPGIPVDLVMNCVDAVRAQITKLQAGQSAISTGAEAGSVGIAADDGADAGDSIRVRTGQLDRLMDLLADVVMWRTRREKRLAELDSADEELARCLFRLQALDDRLRDRRSRPRTGSETVLAHSTSYLSEMLSDIREITQQLRHTRSGIAEENRTISQFIHEFRQTLVQIKRVPLGGLFQRLRRSVREAAKAEGKQVNLQIHGEHMGLERSLQEKLYEPLLHLVRNAVSHGIETPEVRAKSGKPPAGTVTLDAYGSPHVLIIEVRDDGKGLDYDAIRRRGLERGFILADRPVSRAELARLIFRPGFSTREVTSEISGRGIGMNVVEEALDRCQCHIETESEPGCGTRFRLTIPLRSVVEHTLLFRCGGQSFALPMQFIRSASQSVGNARPVVEEATHWLCELLKIPGHASVPGSHWIEIAERLTTQMTDAPSERSMREHRLCLGVDEILGPEEVVVRPLPPLLRRHPHLCGLTISGTGEVVLLLDGRRLLTEVANAEAGVRPVARDPAPAPAANVSHRRRLLVVDDSLSARRRLVHFLRDCFEITEAGDGVEALELLKDTEFDAVFSDLEMPQMSGFQLLEEMQHLERLAPPCVIVTTRNEPETQEQAKQLGAAGFLSKPVDAAVVDEMLSKLGLTAAAEILGESER